MPILQVLCFQQPYFPSVQFFELFDNFLNRSGQNRSHSILIKACRGARPCAQEPRFINDLLGRTAVRPYTRNLGQPTSADLSDSLVCVPLRNQAGSTDF